MMTSHAFTLAGASLLALPSGALHWPAQDLLVVSDLHFGKASRLARRGGALLPPYGTRETLARLDADLGATGTRQVICLGDSFDDLAAEAEMDEGDRLWLVRLMAGREWIWITGNHDPGPLALAGSHRTAHHLGALTFRHIAEPATAAGEVSGHYHPKARVSGPARPCFLLDATRLILPAYGAYTGGLSCEAPELRSLMQPGAVAILTGRRALPVPLAALVGQSRPRSSSFAR
jgi:DNA ligase-associated metallophosphoesterase